MSLNEKLSKHLPKDKEYKLFHVKTQTIECNPLIQYEKGNRPKYNLKAKHYLSIIDTENLIIFGIEINIYLVIFNEWADRYIFVSKCDTTGFSKSFKITGLVSEYLKWLVNLDIKYYCNNVKLQENKSEGHDIGSNVVKSDNQTINSISKLISLIRDDPEYFRNVRYYSNSNGLDNNERRFGSSINPPEIENIKVSFFTRASEQYLFPNSSKNSGKHIVDGKKLLYWWIDVLDNALKDQPWKCYLSIPGSDVESTLRFISKKSKWQVGNIHTTNKNNNRAIANIPLFPDDPKGRFLEHLVVEGRYKLVSLTQFWQELGFRQEFRLGNIVGIIGCELENQSHESNTHITDGDNSLNFSLRQYKRIQSLIKNEDFSIPVDVINLTKNKLPQLLSSFGIQNPYSQLVGQSESVLLKSKPVETRKENNLTNLVRRKAPTNDLSSLVKRKKKTG